MKQYLIILIQQTLFYKISGTWGNHEGSLLLWLLVLTLFIFLFLIKSKNNQKNIEF